MLAPICALVAAAVGVGVFTSGGGGNKVSGVYPGAAGAVREKTPPGKDNAKTVLSHDGGVPGKLAVPARSLPATSQAAGLNAYTHQPSPSPSVPPSGSRAQYYSVDLTLRVSDLSDSTRQAINLTRGWGGYVVSVDSGADRKAGTAYLVVRIPIVKVQTALARLTGLGTILANHVSIQDVQVQLNQRFSRMQALRVQITKLRGKLTNPSLTQSQRDFFQAAINQREGAIANLQKLQAAQQTKASFATVGLDLQTKKAAVVGPPGKPSQIGRALHNIGHVLVVEAEVLLYVLLIGAPFAVLAALLWMGRRGWRRRSENELLAR